MMKLITNVNQVMQTRVFLLLLLLMTSKGMAQFYPVQVTPQLIPPYSVYLSDYATPGSEKLRVIVLQRDLTQPAYQLRLVMSVEWNGKVIMRTARTFNPPPIQVEPGIPTVISGAELAPYLDSRNIDFVGYNREQYERTRALPEGSYRIFFTAYDYRRQDVQVSNEGSSFYYLAKNEPPLINYPACGTKIPARTPQQIVFSWLPRNTASPNSAAETEYEFSLYETRPAGRNPNDVVLTTQPVFRTRVDFTQLVYGPAEPMLFEGMKYVWRVQAIDKNGRDAFRNNGFSEVCTFTYGGMDATFDIGVVKNLQAQGETERRAKIWWQASNYDSYRVHYKKTGSGYEWFTTDIKTTDLKLFDLEPDTEYETRVQVRKSGVFGPYSDIIKFRTTPIRVVQCGDGAGMLAMGEGGQPLLAAHRGMTIEVDGLDVILTEVVPLGGGWYKGMGNVTTKILGASFAVKFDRLYIDASQQAGYGRVDFITRGVAELVQQQLVNQQRNQKQEQQEANRALWAGTLFHEQIFKYDQLVITDISFDNGVVMITDEDGNVHPNPDIIPILKDAPEKAIIIEDKNGDQYVVQKDGDGYKATKVEGGGLMTSEQSYSRSVKRTDFLLEVLKFLENVSLRKIEMRDSSFICLNEKSDHDLVLLQIKHFLGSPSDLLKMLNAKDLDYLDEYLDKLKESNSQISNQFNTAAYEWQEFSCKIYNYLNDLAQGVGDLVEISASRKKLDDIINEYRRAIKMKLNNFTFVSSTFDEVFPIEYSIPGVLPLKIGLIDKRLKDELESDLSINIELENVVNQKTILGKQYENCLIVKLGKANWTFADPPKFLLYAYHSEVARGLNSRKLLTDFLPGKYDYDQVKKFVNHIISSHDRGEEIIDLKGQLSNEQIYARNVDFGDKGIYDLYISRSGNFGDDTNSFYCYTKFETNEVFGFSDKFIQYRVQCKSGGITSISVPAAQAPSFETLVLKLQNLSTGLDYLDLLNTIRTANLNSLNSIDITKFGSKGGLSPVFEIVHNEHKIKVMVAHALLGERKNEIVPSKRPQPITGQFDNAIGKSGTWISYEFENVKGLGSGHNTKIYVLLAQRELFESYLLIEQEVIISGITWRSQIDNYFKGYTCYGPPNECCYQASKTILEQFSVTTDRSHSIDVSVLTSTSNYNLLNPTSNFEAGLEYLESTIKPSVLGGKPVVVGVHYDHDYASKNGNRATYHFIVIVGKGYDKNIRKHYFRYYEVGTSDFEIASSVENRLYVNRTQKNISGSGAKGVNYTITEIRKNY